MQKNVKGLLINSKVSDSSGKIIFDEPELCAQFVREDVEAFRQIAPERVEQILKNTPKHLLDVMGDVLMAFLLKVNVPVEEAENLVGKVREKKMAELFANMEKMDIQAERRNTQEQRIRAERAEKELEEEKRRAALKYEEAVRIYIESCKEFSLSKEETLQRLMEKFVIEEVLAQEIINRYW